MHKTQFPNSRLVPVAVVLTLASVARADFTPIPLTSSSFNQDMVVEKAAAIPLIPGGYTTATVDAGTNNTADTWNEQGYFTQDGAVGIPPAGTVFTSVSLSDHQYRMAPSYTANNAIMLDNSAAFLNSTLTLSSPAAYRALSFLTSGGNGGCVFGYTVHHADGTTETGTASSPDWWNGANPALLANGRVNAQSFSLDNYNGAGNNPRLYSRDITLTNSTSPITSIDFTWVSGNASGHSCIMAVSGATSAGGAFAPINVTGYNADIVVEASAPKTGPVLGVATATMDSGTNTDTTTGNLTGDTWFEQGYYTRSNSFGLPAAGSTLVSQAAADHQYLLPPSYTANNAVFLDPSNNIATVTLATPKAYSALSLLTSSGNGPANIQAVVKYADASTETINLSSPDWFGASPTAWTANGRINVGNSLLENLNSGNPRLASVDFALGNTASPVTSITFNYTNTGGRAVIFALSGAAGAVPPLFTVQPQSMTVWPGSNLTFTAAAAGTAPITYQWQKGTNGVFVDISGATGTSIPLNNVQIPDAADYRIIANNSAGYATSSVAVLTVFSSLPCVTVPSDPITAYQPNGGSSPDAETVIHAIDSSTSKYLNFGNGVTPLTVPVGFVVTPAMGRTIVSGLRFYTANDAPERDPANYILEGSNDGNNWTLISSNLMTLPDGRNNAGQALNPLNQYVRQVLCANTTAYTSYRIYCTRIKGNANLMQIGEVEILGVVDNSGFPAIATQPVNVTAYVNSTATFTVMANGNPAPTYHWLKAGVPLSDGPNVMGATTPNLLLSNLAFSDATNYAVVVANSSGSVTSAPAKLTVVSTLTDVTQPSDPVTAFNEGSGGFWGTTVTNPMYVFDNTFMKYQTGGTNENAVAGFPPFNGPVGVIVTPAVGATCVTGIRFYPPDSNPERDPVDFALDGSNDGGLTFAPIVSGALALPNTRNNVALMVDPLTTVMQEVLFPNSKGFTTYRLVFRHTRDDNNANSLQIGEVELLGGPAATLGFKPVTGGKMQLEWTQGILLEAADLKGPWTTNTATSPFQINPTAGPQKFYRLLIQ